MKQILKLTVLIIALICNRANSQNYPEMVSVKGGTFTMGDEFGEGKLDEQPTHSVTLKGFKIAKTETTVAQYRAYCNATGHSMPETPSWGWNLTDPIVNVSWDDAIAYCDWLSNKTGNMFRLPTEAEWEYAARGGNKSKGFKFSGDKFANDVAWFFDNSGKQAQTVAQKRANELGLYDMSGNVLEWCSDWYDKSYYSTSPLNNPKGPVKGTDRVLRGGSWRCAAEGCRVAIRIHDAPGSDYLYSHIGFRVVSPE